MATTMPITASSSSSSRKRARISSEFGSEYIQQQQQAFNQSLRTLQQQQQAKQGWNGNSFNVTQLRQFYQDRDVAIFNSQWNDTDDVMQSTMTLQAQSQQPSHSSPISSNNSESSQTPPRSQSPSHIPQATSSAPPSAFTSTSTSPIPHMDSPLPIHTTSVTEEHDDDDESEQLPANASRKMKHRQTEQRRRDRLNAGIMSLQTLIGSKKQDKASVVSAAKVFIQQQAEIATRLHAQCKKLTQQLEQVKIHDDVDNELAKVKAEKEALQRQVDALLAQQNATTTSVQQMIPVAMQAETVDYRSTFLASGIARVMFDVLGRFIDANDEFLADTGFTRFELSKPFMTAMSITPAYEHPYALETTRLLQINEKRDMMVMKSFYTTTGKIVCRQTIVAPLRNSSGAITGFVLNGLPTRAEDLPRLIRVCGQQFRHMGCKPPLNHGATVIPSVPGTPRAIADQAIVTSQQQAAMRQASRAGLTPHPFSALPSDFLGTQTLNETFAPQLNEMKTMAHLMNHVATTVEPPEDASGNGAYMTFKDHMRQHMRMGMEMLTPAQRQAMMSQMRTPSTPSGVFAFTPIPIPSSMTPSSADLFGTSATLPSTFQPPVTTPSPSSPDEFTSFMSNSVSVGNSAHVTDISQMPPIASATTPHSQTDLFQDPHLQDPHLTPNLGWDTEAEPTMFGAM